MQTLDLQQSNFLGPASVERVEGTRVLLNLNNVQAWASNAIGYPYRFQAGDVVLAIGARDDWYVIGVLSGSGKTCFQVEGDLQLIAPQGSIEMIAGKGVSIKSPDIMLIGSRLTLVAKQLSQRVQELTTHVKNFYEMIAGRFSGQIEGSYRMHAQKIVQQAEGDVKIDGRKIHLG
jgi:hypothetical protein